MAADDRARLAVVYDWGSASPTEIARGLKDVASVRFIVPRSPYIRTVLPVLEHYGAVSMLDRVLAIGRLPERADGIVTFSERMIPATAALAERLGLAYHGIDVAAGLTDKSRQRDLLASAGVEKLRCQPARNVAELESALAVVGYPAIVKPTRGEGSVNVSLVHDAAQASNVLVELRRQWPENTLEGGPAVLLAEEYLSGIPTEPGLSDYVSVESVAVERRWVHLAIVGNFLQAPPFRETGHFWPAAIDAELAARIADLTSAAFAALAVRTGLGHTEIKLTPSGPRIIELHGRLGGDRAPLLSQAAGVDLVTLAGQAALGQSPVQASLAAQDIHFTYRHQAPAGATRLLQVAGQENVRGLPGVTEYSVTKLPAAVSTISTTYTDLLQGKAATHRELVELVGAASRLLTFTFDRADDAGPITMNGAALNPACA